MYEEQDEITPRDFGVRVLKAFDLVPTSSTKRKDVTTISIDGNMDKTYNYTRHIPFDQPKLLRSNLEAFSSLVSSLGPSKPMGQKNEHHMWKTSVDSAINFPDANQDIIDRCRHNKNKFVQKEFLWSTINQLFKEILDK